MVPVVPSPYSSGERWAISASLQAGLMNIDFTERIGVSAHIPSADGAGSVRTIWRGIALDLGSLAFRLSEAPNRSYYKLLKSLVCQHHHGAPHLERPLTYHPHVHMIAPDAGFSLDGRVACRPDFFLPVLVLSRLFRRLCVGQPSPRTTPAACNSLAITPRSPTARHSSCISPHCTTPNGWSMPKSRSADLSRSCVTWPGTLIASPSMTKARRSNGRIIVSRDRRARQSHDVGSRRVHPPVPHPCAVHRLSPHPPLRPIRQQSARTKHRVSSTAPQRASSAATDNVDPDDQKALPQQCPRCGAGMIVIEIFARDTSPRHRPTPPTRTIRLDMPLPQNAVHKFHPRSAGDEHPHLMISFFLHLIYSITRVPITRGPTTVPRAYHGSPRCSAPSPRHRYSPAGGPQIPIETLRLDPRPLPRFRSLAGFARRPEVRGTVRDGPASENHRNFGPRRTTRERLRSAGVVEPNIVSQQVVSAHRAIPKRRVVSIMSKRLPELAAFRNLLSALILISRLLPRLHSADEFDDILKRLRLHAAIAFQFYRSCRCPPEIRSLSHARIVPPAINRRKRKS